MICVQEPTDRRLTPYTDLPVRMGVRKVGAVTFTLPGGVTLPDQLIWGVAFNTADYGNAPTHKDGPWNSLNVGADTLPGQPAVGTDVEPDGAFLSSSSTDAYYDGGTGGMGTFRYDPTGWADYAPMAYFSTCPIGYAASTPTPFHSIGGETRKPRVTPDPTGTSGSSGGGSSPLFAILICLASGPWAWPRSAPSAGPSAASISPLRVGTEGPGRGPGPSSCDAQAPTRSHAVAGYARLEDRWV